MYKLKLLFPFLITFMVILPINLVFAGPPTETLRPNQDFSSLYSPFPGEYFGSYYTLVNEAVADGDTTYLYMHPDIPGVQYFQLGLTDISGSYTVTGITIYAVAKSVEGDTINLWICTEGYGYDSEDIALPANGPYTLYSYTWLTNPRTGSLWTIDEINNLRAGVDNYHQIIGSRTGRVTQLYVEVGLAPALAVPESPLGTIAVMCSMMLAFAAITLHKRTRTTNKTAANP